MSLTPEDIAQLGLDGMTAGESETVDLDGCLAERYPGTIVPKAGKRLFLRASQDADWVESKDIHLEEGDILVVTVANGLVCAEVIVDGAAKEEE